MRDGEFPVCTIRSIPERPFYAQTTLQAEKEEHVCHEQPKPFVDVPTQLMRTLRMPCQYHSKIDTYEPRILGALITCRRFYKAMHHVVSGIEELYDEIVCQTLISARCQRHPHSLGRGTDIWPAFGDSMLGTFFEFYSSN